jgi:hypothetical protein
MPPVRRPARRPDASDPANATLGAKHLLAMVDGIDHDDLEEILEVAVEELHEGLTELRARVAGPRLERGDVVLGHPEAARKLTLGEVVLVTHGSKADGPDFDVHTDKYTHL